MEKIIYALWAPPGVSPDSFGETLLGPARAALQAAGAERLKISVCDIPPPANDPYTQMKQDAPAALVSAWCNSAAFHRKLTVPLAPFAGRLAAYAVAESTILPHCIPQADGVRALGATQIALFATHKHLSRAAMLDIWLHSHSNVAVETQSTVFYAQNIVTRPLTDNAPAYDAIVEETFPIAALTDRAVYFDAVGDEIKLAAHVARMDESCARFIDFSTIKLMMTGEYRFGGWADFSYGWREHGPV